jgi:hypothetical protein
MAERTAKAIEAIRAETERLGGRLVMPTARANSPAAKHTLLLEAIAEALAGIGAPGEGAAVEPVAAVIAVTVEPEAATPAPAKSAPKARKGKE